MHVRIQGMAATSSPRTPVNVGTLNSVRRNILVRETESGSPEYWPQQGSSSAENFYSSRPRGSIGLRRSESITNEHHDDRIYNWQPGEALPVPSRAGAASSTSDIFANELAMLKTAMDTLTKQHSKTNDMVTELKSEIDELRKGLQDDGKFPKKRKRRNLLSLQVMLITSIFLCSIILFQNKIRRVHKSFDEESQLRAGEAYVKFFVIGNPLLTSDTIESEASTMQL